MCVVSKGPYKDSNWCPKCNCPHYNMRKTRSAYMKVFKHFPIVPRLQRMFKTLAMWELMLWHSKNSSLDGLVRFPCDSKAWKHVHGNYPTFVVDLRNVHLTFYVDGVNPFKLTRSTWSTWHVMLNYNIPLWLTTKRFLLCWHCWF